MILPIKEYLDDGIYFEITPSEIIITTSNGLETTNEIVMDRNMIQKLVNRFNYHVDPQFHIKVLPK
jgi:hypothetical protein